MRAGRRRRGGNGGRRERRRATDFGLPDERVVDGQQDGRERDAQHVQDDRYEAHPLLRGLRLQLTGCGARTGAAEQSFTEISIRLCKHWKATRTHELFI